MTLTLQKERGWSSTVSLPEHTSRHGHRIIRSLSAEMGAWLRLYLNEAFQKSASWSELLAKLRNFGFYLRQAGSEVWLSDVHSHVTICTCTFLGFPFKELEQRFGEPFDVCA